MLSIILAVIGSRLIMLLMPALSSIAGLFLSPVALLFRKTSNPTVIGLVSYNLAMASSGAGGFSAVFLVQMLCEHLQVIPSYGMLLPVIPHVYVPLLFDARNAMLMAEGTNAGYGDSDEEVGRISSIDGWASGTLLGTTLGLIVGAICFLSGANLVLPERVR